MFAAMPQPTFITALLSPDAWPHAVASVRLIETHISWVLLTGEFAYKIKKPVNFGFLDFSTLGKRRHCCEEEVRLNRRLAPEIYLDVVPLCGNHGRPEVGGDGEVFEYAVRMRQFDVSRGFDQLLEAGELSAQHMDQTASMLSRFQEGAGVAEFRSHYGSPPAVFAPVEENFRQVGSYLQTLDETSPLRSQLAGLEQWSLDAFRQLETVIAERQRRGFVRECHGDLHLRNILDWNGRVTPFDCIEFNPDLRWIDVISELAFLLMDLDDHGCEPLSRRLLNGWLEHSGDYGSLQLLRFYQVYRAMVRAKVAGLRLLQAGSGSGALEEEFVNYVDLAGRYTQSTSPRLLITHGLSGSGKTWFTQRLLEAVPLIRLRSDVERKRLFGLAQTQRSDANGDLYHRASSEKTYTHLLETSAQLLNWGYSVVVDAAFLRRGQRQMFSELARQQSVPFVILHCSVDEATQRRRLLERQQSNRDASDADLAVFEQQLRTLEPLGDAESAHCLAIKTDNEARTDVIQEWIDAQ